MVILMAVVVAGDHGKKLLNRPMDVTGEYIGYLCYSLVRRGYLKGNSSRGYQLTSKGRETLFDFMHANESRVKGTVKMLQQLGIEIGQGIDKLGKEAIGVG